MLIVDREKEPKSPAPLKKSSSIKDMIGFLKPKPSQPCYVKCVLVGDDAAGKIELLMTYTVR